MLNIISGFNLFGLDIKFYGIIMAMAMLIGVFVAMYNSKFRGLNKDDILVLACYALPLAIVGARIYYLIFSGRSYTFLEAIAVWNGGLAIYGGVIGGAIGVGLYCLIHKKNFIKFLDVLVPSLILGQALGRWGNFFNQEAYGYAITNESFMWFPFGVFIEHCSQVGCLCSGSGWHLATFFYEFLWNVAVFLILFFLLKKIKDKGIIASLYLVLYGFGRIWIEGLRTDSLYLGPIRVSQLLSIILVVLGILYISTLYILKYKKRKPPKCEIKKP